jgi:hypothetical protein
MRSGELECLWFVTVLLCLVCRSDLQDGSVDLRLHHIEGSDRCLPLVYTEDSLPRTNLR